MQCIADFRLQNIVLIFPKQNYIVRATLYSNPSFTVCQVFLPPDLVKRGILHRKICIIFRVRSVHDSSFMIRYCMLILASIAW